MHVHAGLPWGLQPDHGHLHRKCTLAASPVGSRCIFEAVSPFWTELDLRTVLGEVAVMLFCCFFSPGICPFVTRFLLAETTAYEDHRRPMMYPTA